MKFYSINSSSDKKILGNYPQVKEVKHNCHVWDEEKFIDRLNFKKINFDPITSNAVLYAKSNCTDLINVSSIGFSRKLLISGKLKLIIESNQQEDVCFFKSNLVKKEMEIYDYWVINPSISKLDFIDFNKSYVFLTKNYSTKLKQLNFRNSDEFLKEKDKFKYPYSLIIEKIKINEDVKNDFFVLTDVGGGIKYVVSERLKNEIENAECTGIEFQPIELGLNEWLNSNRRIEKYGKY